MKVVSSSQPKRGNGVTIIINGLALVTQPPIQADQQFMAQATHWFMEYRKGNPQNGQNQ